MSSCFRRGSRCSPCLKSYERRVRRWFRWDRLRRERPPTIEALTLGALTLDELTITELDALDFLHGSSPEKTAPISYVQITN